MADSSKQPQNQEETDPHKQKVDEIQRVLAAVKDKMNLLVALAKGDMDRTYRDLVAEIENAAKLQEEKQRLQLKADEQKQELDIKEEIIRRIEIQEEKQRLQKEADDKKKLDEELVKVDRVCEDSKGGPGRSGSGGGVEF